MRASHNSLHASGPRAHMAPQRCQPCLKESDTMSLVSLGGKHPAHVLQAPQDEHPKLTLLRGDKVTQSRFYTSQGSASCIRVVLPLSQVCGQTGGPRSAAPCHSPCSHQQGCLGFTTIGTLPTWFTSDFAAFEQQPLKTLAAASPPRH